MFASFRGFVGLTCPTLSAKRLPGTLTTSLSSSSKTTKSIKNDNPLNRLTWLRGTSIEAEVLSFGPLGASVRVNDGESDALGLILQKELAFFRDQRGGIEVVLGERLPAFVERIREDGRVDVQLRPVFTARLAIVAKQILEALEGSPSMIIPIGDRSSPEDITAYFYGVSKNDFKKAVGVLYRTGYVFPGRSQTRLLKTPESDDEVIEFFQKSPRVKKKNDCDDVVYNNEDSRQHNNYDDNSGELGVASTTRSSSVVKYTNQVRDDTSSVFVGNLPGSVTSSSLEAVVRKVLGTEIDVVAVRLATNRDSGEPRGFAFVELSSSDDVDQAIRTLGGVQFLGRRLRTDVATKTGNLNRKVVKKVKATLYLGNLAYNTVESDILEWMKPVINGPDALASIRLGRDKTTGEPRGFAHVDFYFEKHAKSVYEQLHGNELHGRRVIVDDATVV